MLRTLPTKHLAELEEQLPEALSNTMLVNGLECKLNNQNSKVSAQTRLWTVHVSEELALVQCDQPAGALDSILCNDNIRDDWLKFWRMQVSYVIETSDAFLRQKRRRQDLSFLVAARARKFHNWYSQHEQTMIPAYASVLGI